MNIKEVRDLARERMKGFCRVCPECNGLACRGEVPGMGGTLTGSAFIGNVEDLKKIKLRMKTIHSAKNPDLSFDFFGKKLAMPIITAPVTGSAFNMGGYLSEDQYNNAVVEGSLEAGTIAMTGDTGKAELFDRGLDAIKAASGNGVPIIKPRETERVIELIKKAEAVNPPAVGMDIDGAGLITMALKGAPVSPKTTQELYKIVSSTNLPFILKGVLTVEDTMSAIEAGVAAIVVSNHGGRVLDSTESTCNALRKIAKIAKDRISILVDGGIRTGVDVFKMLALGADGVLIARPIIVGAFGGEKEGVKITLEKMKNELYQTMILTGARNLQEIDETMII